jgi:hypothetical protein
MNRFQVELDAEDAIVSPYQNQLSLPPRNKTQDLTTLSSAPNRSWILMSHKAEINNKIKRGRDISEGSKARRIAFVVRRQKANPFGYNPTPFYYLLS